MHYISKVALSLLLVFPFPGVVQAAEQPVSIEHTASEAVQQPSDKPILSTSKKRRAKKRGQKKKLTRRQKWARGVGITIGAPIAAMAAIGAAVLGFISWAFWKGGRM